jgi:hypothetical protein
VLIFRTLSKNRDNLARKWLEKWVFVLNLAGRVRANGRIRWRLGQAAHRWPVGKEKSGDFAGMRYFLTCWMHFYQTSWIQMSQFLKAQLCQQFRVLISKTEKMDIMPIMFDRFAMKPLFGKRFLKFRQGLNATRTLRFNNHWYILFLWLIAGPLNPNALIFYYGYETSVLINKGRILDVIGYACLPTALMAAIAIYYLRRKQIFSFKDIVKCTLGALVITLLVSPIFLQIADLFTTSKYASPHGRPLGVFGAIGLFIFTLFFGWLFGMIPVIGLNLAKYAILIALIFLWLGSKPVSKTHL